MSPKSETPVTPTQESGPLATAEIPKPNGAVGLKTGHPVSDQCSKQHLPGVHVTLCVWISEKNCNSNQLEEKVGREFNSVCIS